ncbi:unnamed protein product, partial [marine sediment metagenome]
VLGLEPPAEPPEEIEAVDEGTILHRTLREFYSERRRRRGDARINEDEVDDAAKRICEIADRHLDSFRRRNPGLNRGLFRLQRESMHDVLVKFVHAEFENQKSDAFRMVPRYFEVAFGLPVNAAADDPRSTDTQLVIDMEGEPSVRIIGKIDRIDVSDLPTGEKRAFGFRVIDYKRKWVPTRKQDIAEGTALQMPVYLAAARDVIFAGEGIQPIDAQFYKLIGAKVTTAIRRLKSVKSGIEPDDRGDELIEEAIDFI